jgi:hypothetical protein
VCVEPAPRRPKRRLTLQSVCSHRRNDFPPHERRSLWADVLFSHVCNEAPRRRSPQPSHHDRQHARGHHPCHPRCTVHRCTGVKRSLSLFRLCLCLAERSRSPNRAGLCAMSTVSPCTLRVQRPPISIRRVTAKQDEDYSSGLAHLATAVSTKYVFLGACICKMCQPRCLGTVEMCCWCPCSQQCLNTSQCNVVLSHTFMRSDGGTPAGFVWCWCMHA